MWFWSYGKPAWNFWIKKKFLRDSTKLGLSKRNFRLVECADWKTQQFYRSCHPQTKITIWGGRGGKGAEDVIAKVSCIDSMEAKASIGGDRRQPSDPKPYCVGWFIADCLRRFTSGLLVASSKYVVRILSRQSGPHHETAGSILSSFQLQNSVFD